MPRRTASATNTTTAPVSGLPMNDGPRYHFDIYAILEAPQELYFGSEVAVNVNKVETVEVPLHDSTVVEKCYIAPTKRRGVERRTLIWAPRADGTLLGDALGCGIPGTCSRPTCPICSVYGGLLTGKKDSSYVDQNMVYVEELDATTYVGRLTHGGGVAVQAQETVEKQRAMHPSKMLKYDADNPTPFRREYNQPALLYPVYNHCLSITDEQFEAVAYAFLNVLPRIGAGNPKGVRIADSPVPDGADSTVLGAGEPLLVVDRYRVPLGGRPIVSPAITDWQEAVTSFVAQARRVRGQECKGPVISATMAGEVRDAAPDDSAFTRRIGTAALTYLEEYALAFTKRVLGSGPVPGREG